MSEKQQQTTIITTILFCSHWSLVDVPLISFCPADHVPDWQPRIVLGMVEARSVNVKKATILSVVSYSLEFLVQKYCIPVITTSSILLFWCPYMVINVSIQCYGGLLPDIILLTRFDLLVV